ncbi:unnamed protein product [Phytophthora fragariaefolia]|uniref:Unnamed protein product n=1 Tax=Phytophthora fragariaefolia TaxID=1490495 RepID=A0A9W6XYB4_9STRA|nr:unnamed protein product [Phytophthora fragariaefolia]
MSFVHGFTVSWELLIRRPHSFDTDSTKPAAAQDFAQDSAYSDDPASLRETKDEDETAMKKDRNGERSLHFNSIKNVS